MLSKILIAVQTWSLWPSSARTRILRFAGLDLGEGVLVAAGVRFMGRNIRIGPGSFINEQCLIDATGRLELGGSVYIGQRVVLLSTTHVMGSSACRAGPLASSAVRVGDGAWIGAGATVLPGVTIGAGSVIAAGSMVIMDVDADSLHAGNPARRKRSL